MFDKNICFGKRHKGATLLELMIASTIFAILSLAFVGLISYGNQAWRQISSRHTAEQDLVFTSRNIGSLLKNSDIITVSTGDINGNTWMAFQSALSLKGTDQNFIELIKIKPPNSNQEVDTMQIKWQYFVVYYLKDYPKTDRNRHPSLYNKALYRCYIPVKDVENSYPDMEDKARMYLKNDFVDYAKLDSYAPILMAKDVIDFQVRYCDPYAVRGWKSGIYEELGDTRLELGTVAFYLSCFKRDEAGKYTERRLFEENKSLKKQFSLELKQRVLPLNNSSRGDKISFNRNYPDKGN